MLLVSSDGRLRLRLGMLLPNWGFRVTAVETTHEALERLRQAAHQGEPWTYSVVLADLAGMRNAALSLCRNLERHPAFGQVRLVCLYGDEYVAEELRKSTTVLSRQAPDADLRQALSAPRTPAAAHAPAPAAVAAHGSLRGARVLLVEDNPVNLMVGQRLLGLLHVRCDAAANGEAALARMAETRYDLVLMDCQMPVLDGYAATRRWREREAAEGGAQRLPIVAMTANAVAGDRQKCLDAGMDDYLPKPVTRTELERCLQRWCKPRGTEARACGGDGAASDQVASDHARSGHAGPVHACADTDTGAADGGGAPPGAQDPVATEDDAIPAAPGACADPAAPGPDEPPAIDHVVLDELREVLGGELEQLVRVFLEDAPRLVAQLERAAGRPDYPSLYEAAHALKSSSANLGARGLSEAARRIELAARNESLDRPAVAVALLAGEFERVRAALLSGSGVGAET